jgi:hypothetical protein
MLELQSIAQIKTTQDIQTWFDWASELVTRTNGKAEWTSPDRQKMNMVLAATAYSLVNDEGRTVLSNSRDMIGETLQKHASDILRLKSSDAVSILQVMAVYLLDRLAEHDARAAFDAASEIRGAIPTNSPATEFLHASLSLFGLQIGEKLGLISGADAREKNALEQRVNADEHMPATPRGQLAYELYRSLMAGVQTRVLQAA